MKKIITISIVLLISVTSLSQKKKNVDNFNMNTEYQEVKQQFKYRFFVDNELTIGDGTKIKIGEVIKLGESTSKISNQYESVMVGSFATQNSNAIIGVPQLFASVVSARNTYIITQIKVFRIRGKINYTLELLDINSTAIFDGGKYLTATGYSVQRGEIIPLNATLSPKEALEVLKTAKTKLDLELITESEYQEIKKKMAIIINK